MPKFSVLIIEDEKNIQHFMNKILKRQDYRVLCADTGREGLELIRSQCPDIILLDLGLPDMEGDEIIRSVRTWSSIPIIVISARSAEDEKVRALDLGADDYITKPFGTSELLARIRASLRHSNRLMTDSELYIRPYHCGEMVLDFSKRLLTIADQEVHLTPIEYKIVAFLARNSGKVITYSSILSSVWGPYADDDNKILRVNMANIRRKIEKDPAQPKYIFTEGRCWLTGWRKAKTTKGTAGFSILRSLFLIISPSFPERAYSSVVTGTSASVSSPSPSRSISSSRFSSSSG